MGEKNRLKPINNLGYLEDLLEAGYTIKGLRKNPLKDLASFKVFLKRGKEFRPEGWLAVNGYKFVEPSPFTRGHRIAYKMINNFPDEWFSSNYSLVKGEKEIVLYLKKGVPKIE